MKAFGIKILSLVVVAKAWTQGQIFVSNHVPVANLDAPVFDTDCTTRLEGAAYLVQAYVGFTADSLSPVFEARPFRTGKAAGYFAGYVLTIPGTSQNTLVYLQLRAWEARAGASFEEAVASGGKYGMSNIVPMRTVMPPGPPNEPVGLQSFCLVPEPSSGTLLVLGGVAWLALARAHGMSHRPVRARRRD
jgi:hypothetical protein